MNIIPVIEVIEAGVIIGALFLAIGKLRSYQQKFALIVSTTALKVHFTICIIVVLYLILYLCEAI